MKKILSALLAVAMLVSLLPVAFAEAVPTNAIPQTPGEYLLYEAETYKDQFMADGKAIGLSDSTTTASLSGGGGVNTGGAGNKVVTLTLPVTTEKSMEISIETVAGIAGHLSFPYWSLDGVQFFTYATSNGTQAGFNFTASGDYPAYKHTIEVVIPEGSHELTFNIPARSSSYNGTVAFALDYIKLTTVRESQRIDFPEDAKASAIVNGNTVAIQYDNTAAMQQDGVTVCAPYYKIEIYSYGTAKENLVYSNIFATEKGADGSVSATHIRHIPLKKLLCGQFYAKVYPLSANSYDVSAAGKSIQTEVFTVSERVAVNAIRVEAEEGWQHGDKYVINSSFASAGKFLFSTQGYDWHNAATIARSYAESPLTHTLSVTIPKAGSYNVEALLNNPRKAMNFVSEVVVKLDGKQVISNYDDPVAEDMSINDTFPWGSNPAAKFSNLVELEAKTYEITLEFHIPTGNNTQPYLFSADYIQFTPADDATFIAANGTSTVELEDYVSYFVYEQVDENGESTNNKPNDAKVAYSANASGGAYFATDSYTAEDLGLPLLASIPVYVEKAGLYQFEMIDSAAGSNGSLMLDNKQTIIANISWGQQMQSTGEDVLDAVTQKWAYFDAKYHSGRRNTATLYMSAGAHTLDFKYLVRGAGNTTASIDYMRFTPIGVPTAAISANGGTIELEDYVSHFVEDEKAAAPAAVVEHAKASNGKQMRLTERPMEKGATLDIPVTVEKSGWYDVNAILSYKSGAYTSRITISVDGNPVLVNTAENPNRVDLSEDATYVDKSYPMYRFGGAVYLTAGQHTVNFFAKPREAYANEQQQQDDKGLYRVCFHADNIVFTPVDGTAVANGNDVAVNAELSEAVSGKVIIAAYIGYEMVGVKVTDAANLAAISDTVSCTTKPETVKVMVWNNLENVVPVVKCIELQVK